MQYGIRPGYHAGSDLELFIYDRGDRTPDGGKASEPYTQIRVCGRPRYRTAFG